MAEILWFRELVVMVSTLIASMLPVPPAAPDPPVVAAAAPAVGTTVEQVFLDEFTATPTGAPGEQWVHQASSTPERTELTAVDGRSVLRVRPEGNLMSRDPVPYRVGETYRVSAMVKMPRSTGTHPAFWLRSHLPDRVGEIDVVESWGGTGRCRVQVAFYWRYFPREGTMECLGDRYPADVSGWHEYAAEFTYAGPGEDPATAVAAPTRLFVDGVETWSAPHSPVTPEYLRLQHKRNCPDDQQPSCGEPPGVVAGPSMYVDWVKVERLGRGMATAQPAGVQAVTGTAAGTTELHALDAGTDYTGFSTQTALPLVPQEWRMARGDYDGDRVQDLYAVDPAGTVHVLDGAAGFQAFLAHDAGAAQVDLSAEAVLALRVGDADGDGRGDLHVVGRDGSGNAVVTVLDAASGFAEVISSASTPLPAVESPEWSWGVGDHDNDGVADLHAVNLAGRGGTVEVHVLDGSTGFQTVLTRTSTAMPALDPATWTATWGDHDGDGRVDLQLVDRDDAGRTSVHVLSAASGFAEFLVQQASPLGATTDPAWRLF
ncbi:family 16 glycosylhydrolase [Nocardioides campestrisoli]|uniref:family 16 glycosylhydrolase n=1 Tax=Nocardioides campestrisoli TaxID=2736757 RepID=UPI0015E7AFBE|nr:family 16 glycosylhydrolase [Nocardioides campestrisoli]